MVVSALVAVLVVVAGVLIITDGGALKLPVTHTDTFDAAGIDLPPLVVDGNRLRTAAGDDVVLRGVMIPEPEVVHADHHFNARFVEEVAATGATVIRIPVHPGHWLTDEDYLWRYLDPLVRWAGEAGMYAIIDWHSIGNPVTGTAPHEPDLYAHTDALNHAFWTQVAGYFADAPHVLMEVFNEPQGISEDAWRNAATDLVATIRAQGATQPVIVGGIEYGRILTWVLDEPLADDAVIDASHIYPVHAPGGWDTWFGAVAEQHPVLITEWGFIDDDVAPAPEHAYLRGTAAGFGEPFLDYLDERGIGWVACWWHDRWQPALLDDDGAPTRSGRFILDALTSPAALPSGT